MSDDADRDEIPSGLPEGGPEAEPMGVPEDADAPETGEEAMPGIITDDEPPQSG